MEVLAGREQGKSPSPAALAGLFGWGLLSCLVRSNGLYVVLPSGLLLLAVGAKGKARLPLAASLGGCVACGGCAGKGKCVFDDAVNMAIEKAKTADGFIFGSPVHYASASGNMTSFMDRLSYAGGKYLAYKPAAICCSARRAGTTTTLDQLVKYPQFFHMPLVNGSYWAMVHGSNAEQVLQDAEGCAVMQELGRNMAWLLHCIEAGKAAGFDHPQNPPRPMTNFIR